MKFKTKKKSLRSLKLRLKSKKKSKSKSKNIKNRSYMSRSSSVGLPSEEKQVEESPSGRYLRFNQILGEGSSKIVYKGIDTFAMREIAWNNVDVTNKNNDEKTRIKKEIQILNSMKHPNIMKFYGTWMNKDINNKITNINFATELSSSGSLKDFIYKYKSCLKMEHIKNWCMNLLEGLDYLHSNKIIHRDLKCENIFIDGDTSRVFIGDFGLSIRTEGKSSVGTPEYMAPELYKNISHNNKIDMYAFGMCMLEMITVEPPYMECTNIPQIYKKVINGILPESVEKIKDSNARQIITLLLSFDPNNRPSARELLSNNFFKKLDEKKFPNDKL
jgi:serine/threonine protein kinase